MDDRAEGNSRQLKRFALELTSSLENRMAEILRECGVAVQAAVSPPTAEKTSSRSNHHRGRDFNNRHHQSNQNKHGMDFGSFTADDLYAQARQRASAVGRKRRKPILNLRDLLEWMKDEEVQDLQRQRRLAWQSVASVERTLMREFGIRELRRSCGWSSLHLSTTAMMLLKTVRNFSKAHKGSAFGPPPDFLRGATLDIR